MLISSSIEQKIAGIFCIKYELLIPVEREWQKTTTNEGLFNPMSLYES
jgi:hypothetical protein